MNKINDSLYIGWTIALKDIRDAVMNKSTRANILVLVGLVLFFYWASTIRPFDKQVSIVLFDQGGSKLNFESKELSDGRVLEFRPATSLVDMEKKMAYQDLGLVIPADESAETDSTGGLTLSGYVHWAKRGQVADLEEEYSALLSELLGLSVVLKIGDNILIPPSDSLGVASTASFHVFFAILWMAVTVVPFLMLEERQTKTMDALLVSPASPGQVVFGKALAGLILIIAIAGISLALNGIYVTSWGWAAVGFLITALFAIGIALLIGSSISSGQQIRLWILPIALFLVVPAFFADEPNLTPVVKSVLSWIPTTAIARIIGFSVSNGTLNTALVINMAIAMISIAAIYLLVILQIRRLDR
jgi:ABC-2 type transport system permease protein